MIPVGTFDIELKSTWDEPLIKLSPSSLPYLKSNSVVNWADELITPSRFNLSLTYVGKLSLNALFALTEFLSNGVITAGRLSIS